MKMSKSVNKSMVVAIVVSVIVASLVGFGTSYATFQPSVDSLQTSNTQLQNNLTNLEKAYITASIKDDKLSNAYSHNVKGTIVNFGSVTANNIVIVVKWYLQGTSFHQETITIPSLAGRTLIDLSFSYVFGGSADSLQYTITWD